MYYCVTFKTKQRAAVGMPGHRARSRVRCINSEPWWKVKRDPRSVPAITPRCPDNRWKFRVHGKKYVVSQNIMITHCCCTHGPVFFPLTHHTIYASILYKVEDTQYKIYCVSKHDYRCVCVCVFFPSILDIKFVGRTSRGHTGGRSHRIFNPPSFCGACLDFCREKDSAIPFPRRP